MNVGIALVGFCGTVFAMRRRLLTSEVNTRLVVGVLLTGGAIFVQRLANCIPVPPTAALVSSEIFFCAYGASLGGLTLVRWLWLQVPFWLAGAFAARIWPSYAGMCFAISALCALSVGLWKTPGQHTKRSQADRA